MTDEKDKHDEKPQVDSKGEKPGDVKSEVATKVESVQSTVAGTVSVASQTAVPNALPGKSITVHTSGYMAPAPPPTTPYPPSGRAPVKPKFSVVDAIGLGVGSGTIVYVILHFVLHKI